MFELFGFSFSWMSVIVVCAILFLIILAIRKAVVATKRNKRHFDVKDALTNHNETILFCVRCVSDDAAHVATCISHAIDQAQSPLRVKFAVVQEDATDDVYEQLTLKLKDVGDGHDYDSHVRTENVLDSNGFMEALTSWQHLYENETYVVLCDHNNIMAKNWDVGVVDAIKNSYVKTVLSSPGPQQFPCIFYGTPNHRYAPIVKGVTFPVKPTTTSTIAACHNFCVFHGQAFKQLIKPRKHHYVPKYILDVTLSDYLFRQGFKFKSVPFALYRTKMNTNFNNNLEVQRPRSWTRKYFISRQYCEYAGLEPEFGFEHQHKNTDKCRKRRHKERQRYLLANRTKLGLLGNCMSSGGALQKYGTHSELTRRRNLVQRIRAPFKYEYDGEYYSSSSNNNYNNNNNNTNNDAVNPSTTSHNIEGEQNFYLNNRHYNNQSFNHNQTIDDYNKSRH